MSALGREQTVAYGSGAVICAVPKCRRWKPTWGAVIAEVGSGWSAVFPKVTVSPMRDPPPSFGTLCEALHQDAIVFHGGTLEAQADECVRWVPREAHPELLYFLKGFLERRDTSELRRALRKQKHVALSMPRTAWWTLFILICERLAVDR